MLRITEVVKHLLIINVLMYIGTFTLMGDPSAQTMNALANSQGGGDFASWGRFQLALFYPTSEYFRIFQVVTHMFMHADSTHIFFNMFALFMFGPMIEDRMGPKRFLQYYMITGMGAMALHMFVRYLDLTYGGAEAWLNNVPMLGASGAVFGLLAAFAMFFPNQTIYLIFPPIPLKAWVFVSIYAAIELFSGLSNFNSGVAHFAHLGGALFGFLLILYWRRTGSFI